MLSSLNVDISDILNILTILKQLNIQPSEHQPNFKNLI